MVERTNLRRYVNGKYIGLTSREVRSFISPADSAKAGMPGETFFDGNFYVMEETLRNSHSSAQGIHEAIPSTFKISPEGKVTMLTDNGYPSFRSFPAYINQKVSVGDQWKSDGERAVDPLNKGIVTRMPMIVRYTFSGEEEYNGQPVYRIKAIWQTYYDLTNKDPRGDSSLEKARGGHKADIIVLQSNGSPILVIDNVDETFFYNDGSAVNFKGSITLFTEFPPAVEHDKLLPALQRIARIDPSLTGKSGNRETAGSVFSGGTQTENSVAKADKIPSVNKNQDFTQTYKTDQAEKISGELDLPKSEKIARLDTPKAPESLASTKVTPSDGGSNQASKKEKAPQDFDLPADKNDTNIVAEKTNAGLRLSVRDIKFLPDSSEVAAGESARLDEIAKILKLAPDSQFLVEGHTAAVGKAAGEQKLSEERAKKIAQELSKRGIAAGKFICRGHGGTRPVADNKSESGRTQNRRVEITILE